MSEFVPLCFICSFHKYLFTIYVCLAPVTTFLLCYYTALQYEMSARATKAKDFSPLDHSTWSHLSWNLRNNLLICNCNNHDSIVSRGEWKNSINYKLKINIQVWDRVNSSVEWDYPELSGMNRCWSKMNLEVSWNMQSCFSNRFKVISISRQALNLHIKTWQ